MQGDEQGPINLAIGVLLIAMVALGLSMRATDPAKGPAPKVAERPRPDPEHVKKQRYADKIIVPGHEVEHWFDPSFAYGRTATRKKQKFKAVVMHWADCQPPTNCVLYGLGRDKGRRGAFGYHVYIDRKGRIYQGAPLSKRTNHVMPYRHKTRRPGPHAFTDNTNALGVALLNTCKRRELTGRCVREDITSAQKSAAIATVLSIQRRFELYCQHVYGHGELQKSRSVHEGLTISRLVRDSCDLS